MNKKNFLQELKKQFPNAIGNLTFLETPDGWNDLIAACAQNLESEISSLNCEERKKYGAVQIKEKFGGLRWYTSHLYPKIDEIIRKYENLSMITCETCGEPGERSSIKGWIFVACKKHFRQKKID